MLDVRRLGDVSANAEPPFRVKGAGECLQSEFIDFGTDARIAATQQFMNERRADPRASASNDSDLTRHPISHVTGPFAGTSSS